MTHSERPGSDDDWRPDLDELFKGIGSFKDSLPEEKKPTIINPPTERQVAAYERLVPMLHAARQEMSELSKKKPDGIVNSLKIRNINRVLTELQKLLANDPSREFVELLDEDTLPQNSDVVLLLSQWQTALVQYKDRYYISGDRGAVQWITVENPGPYVVQETAEIIPGFRSSGVIVLNVIRADGRQEIIGVQANTVPVTPTDEGNIETAVRTAIGTFKDYPKTMTQTKIIEALSDAAVKLGERES